MSRFEGKTEKPTARRRRKARREGQNAKTPEAAAALSLLGGVIAARTFIPGAFDSLVDGTRQLLANSGAAPSGAVVRPIVMDMLLAGLVPMLAMAVVLAIVANLAQTGFTLAPAALKPKLSNLSIAKGLKRLSPSTLIWDAGRTFLKLALLAALVYSPVKETIDQVQNGHNLAGWLHIAGEQVGTVLLRATLLAVLIAGADYAIKRMKTMKSMKMSKQEVKQEHKEQEGDPHYKAARRRRAAELSRNRMIFDVAGADVVLTNPTHFAVALKYNAGEPAPRVVAKGMGPLALKIRSLAYRHGILVKQDPPLARAIYRRCKVGGYIPGALYEAVAVVLAVAYRRRSRRVA